MKVTGCSGQEIAMIVFTGQLADSVRVAQSVERARKVLGRRCMPG
jgi:hypothetical protein